MTPESSFERADAEALYPIVYDELKRMARGHLRSSGPRLTINTTELVHEAFLKLSAREAADWDGRAHFFGAAARAMRQVLVDFARRRGTGKRGGSWRSISLDAASDSLQMEADEVLALDAALDRLNRFEPRLRQVVELRFFCGVPEREIAELLGVSTRTVERDWVKARLLLLDVLEPQPASRPQPVA